MSLFSRNRTTCHTRKRHHLRPWLDALEDRFLLTAGDLDTTFGSGGVVLTAFPTVEKGFHGSGGSANAVQIQSDGKIVAAGEGLHNFAVSRYNTGGSLDPTFGNGGKVVTTFGTNHQESVQAIAIQPDGKIIAVGATDVLDSTTYENHFAIARYNTNGTLDTSFGPNHNGLVTTGIVANDSANGVVIQPDGKIVVAGSAGSQAPLYGQSSTVSDALVRYNSNGTLDTSFGQGGILTPTIVPGASQRFYDVALESVNGTTKIVVAGVVPSPYSDVVIARFNLDGSFDTSFGSGGSVILGAQVTGFNGGRLAIQPDGKIIEAGSTRNSLGIQQGAVARFNINGSLDSTFNPVGPTPGIAVVAGTGGGGYWHGAVQPDGKIVGAGIVQINNGFDMLLTRLNADGSPDPTFGTNGVVLDSLIGGASARDLAIQSDGKIVTAGDANANGDFAIARFLGDPPRAGQASAAAMGSTPGTGSGPLAASQASLNPVAPGAEAFDQALGTVALGRSARSPYPVAGWPGRLARPVVAAAGRWSPGLGPLSHRAPDNS
jgi:uncharacterized delta-60 repeat protein